MSVSDVAVISPPITTVRRTGCSRVTAKRCVLSLAARSGAGRRIEIPRADGAAGGILVALIFDGCRFQNRQAMVAVARQNGRETAADNRVVFCGGRFRSGCRAGPKSNKRGLAAQARERCTRERACCQGIGNHQKDDAGALRTPGCFAGRELTIAAPPL
jgi:hypothetical protein